MLYVVLVRMLLGRSVWKNVLRRKAGHSARSTVCRVLTDSRRPTLGFCPIECQRGVVCFNSPPHQSHWRLHLCTHLCVHSSLCSCEGYGCLVAMVTSTLAVHLPLIIHSTSTMDSSSELIMLKPLCMISQKLLVLRSLIARFLELLFLYWTSFLGCIS